MEGGVHRGSWIRKAPVGTTLLLMCIFIPTLISLQPSEQRTCPHGDILTDNGICCNKCPRGFKLVEECHGEGRRSNCTRCPKGQFSDEMNYQKTCRSCRQCKQTKYEETVSSCKDNQNTICRCKDGYYKSVIDSQTYECLKCKQCGRDEKKKHSCTPENNTVCECTENYHKVNGYCEPCNNCTTECKHHCPSPRPPTTIDPYKVSTNGKDDHVNIIAGTVSVAMVLVFLVFVITYTTTKRTTKKKFMKLSSQPSDASPDSCKQVLIHTEEPCVRNTSVKVAPESPVSDLEQPSKLPDCVPLEIKIPDLIYTVLDLVPVLQVKRLVRSLGVNDTEIEHAELDHRSCREAHYQMLRVWAERGSFVGEGGRGGMLHQALLRELIDELKKMHLGQAAEELETKYRIQ